MRLAQVVIATALLTAFAGMPAAAGADEHPANPTNPVVSTTGSFPQDFAAETGELVITTENPAQGPFTCRAEMVGTFDNAAGNATLDDLNITQPGSVECGGFFDPFDFPWAAQVCIDAPPAGPPHAWLHLDVKDINTPLGDYHGPIWLQFSSPSDASPVGPIAGFHVDDTLPAFSPGDGPMHWLGDFSLDTLGSEVTVEAGTGSCAVTS